MKLEYEKLDDKIMSLKAKGFSYSQIARELGVTLSTVRRRFLRSEKPNRYGKEHYFRNKYVIAIYDYESEDLLIVCQNINELAQFLNRKHLNSYISRHIDSNNYKISNITKTKYYKFKLVDKGESVSEKY